MHLNNTVKHHQVSNHIGVVMVSLLALSVVDCGIKPPSGQVKDYNIGMRCFSAKHVVIRSKSKDRLALNQDNVSEWADMFICVLLF
jgi:hypothetical protein